MSAIELLTHTWWSFEPESSFSIAYRSINLVEGCCWLLFAGLVYRRYRKKRHSPWEVAYALAFVTFGLSDFREAVALQTWLILLKGTNLVVLLLLRRKVLREYYPTSRTF